MATTTLAPRQVEGLEEAYKDIEALKQQVKEQTEQVKMLTERLAEIETSSQLDPRQFPAAEQEALR